MLTHTPIDVAAVQEILRDLAAGKSESIQDPELQGALLQVERELPYWQLTAKMLVLDLDRAQWLFQRLVVLWSGTTMLLDVKPNLEEANNEVAYSYWLSQVGQAISRAHTAELRLTRLQAKAKEIYAKSLKSPASCDPFIRKLAEGEFLEEE